MTTPSPSRNHKHRPGDALLDAVFLPGWEDQSIWGWDTPTATFYAQLWRNSSKNDAPDIWISGIQQRCPWPSSVALEIVEQTGSNPAEVVAALGIADPAPSLRPNNEVIALLQSAVDKPKTNIQHGAIHALGWAQGYAQVTPSQRVHWDGPRPTAAQVDAEHHLATGYLYRPEADRNFFSGVDSALWWLLGRNSDTWFL